MDSKLKGLLQRVFRSGASDAEIGAAVRRLIKQDPNIADKLLNGQEITPFKKATDPKPKVVVKEVKPTNYDGLVRMAMELTSLKVKALKNGISNHGNRYMRVTEVEAHLTVLGKKPEDFAITQDMLNTWSKPPLPEPKGPIARALYRAGKRAGKKAAEGHIDYTA